MFSDNTLHFGSADIMMQALQGCEEIIVLAPSRRQGSTGQFANFEHGLYIGGQIRMDAAVHLAKQLPEVSFVLVGGYNMEGQGDVRTSDKVNGMADFIHEKAPHVSISKVYSLPCTHHNFVAALHARSRNTSGIPTIGVLTNAYHLPRAMEFATRATHDLGAHIRFVPIAAEAVLNISIEDFANDKIDQYNLRIEREKTGLKQITEGTYQDSCLTKNLERLSQIIAERSSMILTDEELEWLHKSR